MATRSWGCCADKDSLCEDIQDLINCIKCNKSFHFACLSISKVPADSEAYRKWKCSGCVTNTSKTEGTPNRNVSTTRGNKRPALSSPPQATPVTTEEVRTIVQEVMKAEFASMLQQINNTILSIVNKELEPIKRDIKELATSLNFHTEEFEKFQSEHEALKNTMKNLTEENNNYKTLMADLNHRINYLEQQTRSNNLELQCLPENKQENLYTVVKQLGSVVGCVLSDNDILHCTRVAKLQATNSRPRSVVVQLASPRIRDNLLASTIEYNKGKKTNAEKLNSADLGMAGDKKPVYVLEHLSPSNKALHAATRLRAKDKGYKFVWARNGRIFVRKTAEADHILIKTLDSLNKLT